MLKYFTQLENQFVVPNSNTQRVPLLDNLIIDLKKINYVNFCCNDDSYYPNLTSVQKANVNSDYLVLVNKANQIINKISLSYMIDLQNRNEDIRLNLSEIDLSSSYLLRMNNTDIEETTQKNYSFIFGILEDNVSIDDYYIDNISIPFTAGKGMQRLFFPDEQSFRNRKLIELLPVITSSTTPNSYINAPAAFYKKALITIEDTTGKLVVNHVPLYAFLNIDRTAGSGYLFNNVLINWAKSFIEFDSGDTDTNEYEFFFNLRLTKNW